MKQVLFVMTHLGSDWEMLAEALERNPRIQVYNTGTTYQHPDQLQILQRQIHKQDNAVAVRADVIFHNKDFTMKRLCSHFPFIFWTKHFEQCEEALRELGYDGERAKDYWTYRMAGLNQYYGRSPRSLWNPSLEADDLFEAFFG